MRMPCIAIITLLSVIGSAGAVVAQMNTEEVPAVFVTGTVIDDTATEDEGRATWVQTVEWSDPRFPPTLRAEATWYIYGGLPEGLDEEQVELEVIEDALVMVTEMNVLLDGSEGSWQGTGRALEQGTGPDPDRHYSYYVLEGAGAYDGMHALLRGAPGHDADGPWDDLYEGWIIESDVPPLPGSPTASR